MDYMSYESIQFYSKMVHSCLRSTIYFNPLITDSATIMLFIYYSTSAAVAVDSSQTTVSSSASWADSVRLQILLMGTCHIVVHGLSLATTTERRLGETPFVQVSLDVSGNGSSETTYDEGDQNMPINDNTKTKGK